MTSTFLQQNLPEFVCQSPDLSLCCFFFPCWQKQIASDEQTAGPSTGVPVYLEVTPHPH